MSRARLSRSACKAAQQAGPYSKPYRPGTGTFSAGVWPGQQYGPPETPYRLGLQASMAACRRILWAHGERGCAVGSPHTWAHVPRKDQRGTFKGILRPLKFGARAAKSARPRPPRARPGGVYVLVSRGAARPSGGARGGAALGRPSPSSGAAAPVFPQPAPAASGGTPNAGPPKTAAGRPL